MVAIRRAVRVTWGPGLDRPYVYALARELGLSGHVGNDARRVHRSAGGDGVEEFRQAARRRATAVGDRGHPVAEVEPQVESGFRIVESAGSQSGEVIRSRRTPRSARTVCGNCATPTTVGSATRSSRARTAVRGTRWRPAALRPGNIDGRLPAVRGVRSRVHRSRQSPVPRSPPPAGSAVRSRCPLWLLSLR